MAAPTVVDLAAVAASGPTGTLWSLPEDGDLGAALVVLEPGGEIARHANREADLLLVGVAGTGRVTVGDTGHDIGPGTAVHVPRGVPRHVSAGEDRLALLTVHRRVATSRRGLARRRWTKMERADDE